MLKQKIMVLVSPSPIRANVECRLKAYIPADAKPRTCLSPEFALIDGWRLLAPPKPAVQDIGAEDVYEWWFEKMEDDGRS